MKFALRNKFDLAMLLRSNKFATAKIECSLAVANSLAHNDINLSQICYFGQISLQSFLRFVVLLFYLPGRVAAECSSKINDKGFQKIKTAHQNKSTSIKH